MPYIGKSPLHGNFNELTDVSGSFDGSETEFALTENISSTAITPIMPAALIISINGVVQEPTTDYTVSGTNITFTTAPAATDSFFGIAMGKQLDVGTPSDSTVTPAKMNITSALVPATADGAALGSTSAEWSDLFLADGGIIKLGSDQDVTLTHVADTGILLNSTMQLQFNDSSQYINAPSNAILDINATDEVEVNATLMDVNANLDVSGTYTGGGTMTTGGNIVIPDAGNIGSASDTNALSISSGGVVAVTATTANTSASDGALTVGGGLGVAADASIGDDLRLISDAAVLSFGADSDITLTHAADTSLTVGGAGGTTGVIINNTATDGDPFLAFSLSGTQTFTMGVDDGDSDKFKIGTTAIGSSTAFSMDSSGNVAITGDLTVTGDDLYMNTNTSGYILVADGTNYNPVAVSGDVTMSAAGAITIANDAIETAMLNDNIISGQTALTSGLATTDELLLSDGGTLKRVDVSIVTDLASGDATALAIALG